MSRLFFVMISFVLVCISSCIDFDEEEYDKRMVIKQVTFDNGMKVEWYHYSGVSGYSASYIDLKRGNKKEPICKSAYVSDIIRKGDTLIVQLWEDVDLKLHSDAIDGIRIISKADGVQPSVFPDCSGCPNGRPD